MRRVLLILTLSLTIASVPISGYCETYNICNDECSVNIGDPNWEVYTQDNYQDAGDSSISSMFESGAADMYAFSNDYEIFWYISSQDPEDPIVYNMSEVSDEEIIETFSGTTSTDMGSATILSTNVSETGYAKYAVIEYRVDSGEYEGSHSMQYITVVNGKFYVLTAYKYDGVEFSTADKQRLGGFIYNISFDEQIGSDENRPPTRLEQERSATLAAIKAVFPFAILVIGYKWFKSKKKKQNENSEPKDEIKE